MVAEEVFELELEETGLIGKHHYQNLNFEFELEESGLIGKKYYQNQYFQFH